MFQEIISYVTAITTIGTCAALLIKPVREWVLGTKTIREGQLCLLRSEIVKIYYRNREKQTLHQYEYENLAQCYAAYEKAGGNSFVKHIYKDMQDWEVIQ